MAHRWRTRKIVPTVFQVEKPLPQTERELKEFNALYQKASPPRAAATEAKSTCCVRDVNVLDALRWSSMLALANFAVGALLSLTQGIHCPCTRKVTVICCSGVVLLTETPLWFSWCMHPKRLQCLLAHSWLASDVLRISLYIAVLAVLVSVEVAAPTAEATDFRGSLSVVVMGMVVGASIVTHCYHLAAVVRRRKEIGEACAADPRIAAYARAREQKIDERVNRLASRVFVRRWKRQVGQYMFTERQVSGNPIFDTSLIIGSAWGSFVHPMLNQGPRRMTSLCDFESDDAIESGSLSSPRKQRVPTAVEREAALDWLIDVLARAEEADKSAAGPFVADKFGLQAHELAKQVIGSTLLLPISSQNCSLRQASLNDQSDGHCLLDPVPGVSSVFKKLQSFARQRLEVHQQRLEAVWAGDAPRNDKVAARPSTRWTKGKKIVARSFVLSALGMNRRGPSKQMQSKAGNDEAKPLDARATRDAELAKIINAEVNSSAEDARFGVLDEIAQNKVRQAKLDRRVAFRDSRNPRQDDVVWCSLIANGVFHNKNLSLEAHDTNNIRYITLLSYYATAMKCVLDAKLSSVIVRHGAAMSEQPIKSFMSMWKHYATVPPPGHGIYNSSNLQVPRSAALLDIVRTVVSFEDPVKMVDAFNDMEIALAKIQGVSPFVRVDNSYARGATGITGARSSAQKWGFRALKVTLLFEPDLTWGEMFERQEFSSALSSWKARIGAVERGSYVDQNGHSKSTSETRSKLTADRHYMPQQLRQAIFNIGIPFAEAEIRKSMVQQAEARFLVEVSFLLEDFASTRGDTDLFFRIARATREVDLLADLQRGRDEMAATDARLLRNQHLDQSIAEHMKKAIEYWHPRTWR